ncbi:MAG: alpha/beta hydrolase [Gemmatimonadaceae bacterium]
MHYQASDGQRLKGFVIGNPATAPVTLLCFHGNADLSIWQLDWARSIEERTGSAVMLSEYRGYMSLDGKPTYSTTKLDAEAAYSYLCATFGIGPEKLAFFGHSLGSAIAAELAQVHRPRGLILQSPFTSARAMARIIVVPPISFVWRAISRIHFDTTQVVRTLDVPTAVAHGKRDRIVPFRMGLEVYNAAKIKGPLLVVENAGHSDIARAAGEKYWTWISTALRVSG